MKKDRLELEQNLDDVLTNYNANKNILNNLKNNIKEHGISSSEVGSIWKKNTHLDSISEPTLYLLTKYLYILTEEETINPQEYFTELETSEGDKIKNEVVEHVIEYPIVFNEVIKVREGQYSTSLTFKQLNDYLNYGVFKYNFETQRDPKWTLDKKNDKLIKTININDSAVKTITELILENRFIPNKITINLLQNGQDKLSFKQKSHELAIIAGDLNIIDGFHRTLGISGALLTNPDIDDRIEVRITNWDIQKAKEFIKQENIRNLINKQYLESDIDIDKISNKVVTKLNENSGELRSKIVSSKDLIKKYSSHSSAYTMFNIMSDSIGLLWDNIKNFEVNDLAQYLIEYFNYIIGYKAEDFMDNLTESKKYSVITMPAMFVGYLTWAKKLQDNNNWRNELRRLLDEIDFDINNPKWVELQIIDTKSKPILDLKKPALKNIINYFMKVV